MRKIEAHGFLFRTIKELSIAYEVPYDKLSRLEDSALTLWARGTPLPEGWDERISEHRKRLSWYDSPVMYKGVFYNSVDEAAEKTGVTRYAVARWINRNKNKGV